MEEEDDSRTRNERDVVVVEKIPEDQDKIESPVKTKRLWTLTGLLFLALAAIVVVVVVGSKRQVAPEEVRNPTAMDLVSNTNRALGSKLSPILSSEYKNNNNNNNENSSNNNSNNSNNNNSKNNNNNDNNSNNNDNNNSNLVTSIYSLASALTMVLTGSGGITAEQIRTPFDLKANEEDTLCQGYKEASFLIKGDGNFTLETASKIFVHRECSMLQSYLDLTYRTFGQNVVENVDFSRAEEAAKIINTWVSERTNNKIVDLINADQLDERTKAVMLNAIYFKGTWVERFEVMHTEEKDFHGSHTEVVKVQMMFRSGYDNVHQSKDLQCQILELPYKGDRLSMLLLLPHTPEGFRYTEERFSSFDFSQLKRRSGEKPPLDIHLPRFKVESTLDLSESLKMIGLTSMFDKKEANFSRMTKPSKGLYVSSAVQKAFIEVNEEGAEAAAATAFQINNYCLGCGEDVPKKEVIRFDRPFLFAIRDKLTGMVLFEGRVKDPTKSD